VSVSTIHWYSLSQGACIGGTLKHKVYTHYTHYHTQTQGCTLAN